MATALVPTRSPLRARVEHALRPWRRANPTARRLVVVGLLITLLFAVLALFAEQIAPYGQDQYRFEVASDGADAQFESIPRRVPPQDGFPFGTTAARLDVY